MHNGKQNITNIGPKYLSKKAQITPATNAKNGSQCCLTKVIITLNLGLLAQYLFHRLHYQYTSNLGVFF